MGTESAVKVQYTNPFLESTVKLFNSTFNINPKAGNLFLVKNQIKHRWEISGVMILTGSAIGVVSIRLTRHLSQKLLEKSEIYYETQEERDQLTNGMVGELVNIIAGNASSQLSGYNIKVSVPFVIQGENHSIAWPENAPIIGIPFTTAYGPFVINVSLFKKTG